MYRLRITNSYGREIVFGLESGFIISKIDDMSKVDVTVSMSQGSSQIGGTVQGQTVKSKNIIVSGMILGRTKDKRKELLDMIIPQISGNLIYNETWDLGWVAKTTPAIENNDYNAKFQFAITAPYPYWVSHNNQVVELTGMIGAFQFPWNYETPHMFGQRIQYINRNTYNQGNVPASFVLQFYATNIVENPSVTKLKTGEFIRINKEMTTGEIITLDMTVSPIRLTSKIGDVSTNIFGRLDLESTPFKLDVGDNVLQAEAEEGKEWLDTTIQLRGAYTGPW